MSNMDIPLGFYIGNALEVREAVEVLRGHGCPTRPACAFTLAANMLHLCNGWPIEEATKQAEEAITSGKAFEQMKRWIAAQGGDARVLDDVSLLPQAAVQYELALQAGYIHHMDAQKIGESSAILGAGRKTKDDTIDFAAGIVLKEKDRREGQLEPDAGRAAHRGPAGGTLADAERVFFGGAIRWGTDAARSCRSISVQSAGANPPSSPTDVAKSSVFSRFLQVHGIPLYTSGCIL